MLDYFNKKLSSIENFLVLFVGISIFIVMILTSIQIISRVVGYPWPAFLELSELAISIFAFLGVAFAQRMDAHIRMELLVANLKGRIKWIVEFLATFCAFIVMFFLYLYPLIPLPNILHSLTFISVFIPNFLIALIAPKTSSDINKFFAFEIP